MRLEKIKLAGFKSFVDPTTVTFPGNLVGVVGPNGCGKSNVIDAVRWVMGESSAKMLRGESMADVIFNGSSSRKPVGVASIELLFDNADGKAGGKYAQYGQIAVKRQVNRNGQSSYSLNGVRCRRRDITDLFLGTGLGPRSYAIIEQGMISRLIESRPEELRVYLEEAAGISRYKERRRETETRIRHTRENLERLDDLREEIGKQLKRLERQARTAEKYQRLKQQERQLGAELLLLKRAQLEADLQTREQRIDIQEKHLQAARERQQEIEREIEQQRAAHAEANESFNEIQGRYYAVGSDIARLQESVQHARDSRDRQQAELARTEKALREAEQHCDLDRHKLADIDRELTTDQPELELAEQGAEEAAMRLEDAEQAMQAWQSQWEEFNVSAAKPAQQAQVERTRIDHLEQQERQLRRRQEKLQRELEQLSDPALQAEIADLQRQRQEGEQQVGELRQETERAVARIAQLREDSDDHQQELADVRAELEVLNGRLASLQALQQAALGDDEETLRQWLEAAGLGEARRLLAELEVEPRWQGATEMVLASHLQASCVQELDSYVPLLRDFHSGRLNLFSIAAADAPEVKGTLAEYVRGPDSVRAMLAQVLVAEDPVQGMQIAKSLAPGQSVVTSGGVWLGRGWLRFHPGEDARDGMLAREQEIRELEQRQRQLAPRARQLQQQLVDVQTELAAAEDWRDRQQQALQEASQRLAERVSRLGGKQARAEHIRQRLTVVETELADIDAQFLDGTREMESARSRLHRALESVQSLNARRETLAARREQLQGELADARQEAREKRQQAHRIALRIESMRSSESSLRSAIERAHGQLAQLQQRAEELRAGLESARAPIREQQQMLEEKISERAVVEAELADARGLLEQIDSRLRELEQLRHESGQQLQGHRAALDESRLLRQEVVVRSATLEEQLQQTGLDVQALQEGLPEDATLDEWKQQQQELGRRIAGLGAINLAAIEEFEEQTQRMCYLDSQHQDVSQALQTLENAIQKIDRETRTRFKETFERVNNGLQEMFPKLFGGGHAYLELVGDDLLDAGVAIMARPPGKRNSSIHLLSGGEKALSAVAMVFSIFQLNPAPFCMLDEVDAPLDDANVGRFCDLVREMADSVQFIFITHNKVTMEIANQLVGVTMNEPGVSRLVTVDIDEATQMAVM